MEATQSFRLVGTTVILEISCDHDDGHNIIYWHDVLDAFPGAQYVKSGDTLVKRSRDTGIGRNKPQHIKHHPGVILDAVALSPIVIDPATSSTIYSKLSALSSRSNGLSRTFSASPVDGNIIGDLEIAPPTADRDIVKLEQRSAPDSAFEQRLISFLPPDIQPQVLASSAVYAWTVQAIQNGQVDRLHEQFIVCLQDLKDEMTKNNELASRNNELASRNNELASKNNALASRNNGLVCDVKELENKNNEMASRNNELASRISELASKNNELNTLGAKQEEMKQLQDKTLDQLALLQNRVRALMTQTYELHEYPIPRLFVVLPQDTLVWNPEDLFSNKFRLYFIPHHLHLAEHEGYEITQPKEFFQQYGSYVLTILKMLKLGISVVGIAIPTLSRLHRTIVQHKDTGNIQAGWNQAIGCLEKITANNGKGVDEFSEQLRTNEALEGADLRKPESFIKNRDGSKVLWNLYGRTVGTKFVKNQELVPPTSSAVFEINGMVQAVLGKSFTDLLTGGTATCTRYLT
ncbi:hypothetical protein B0O80DRAFT_424023 [Mortierella sp. GBAus27b]|nr:hypothetical protein B0O80DRAFT_424023 [Mortierella sp. GBAus27b]